MTGMNHSEIAKVLNVSRTTVRQDERNAIRKIREMATYRKDARLMAEHWEFMEPRGEVVEHRLATAESGSQFTENRTRS